MRLVPYLIKNCYDAQITGMALFNLQTGYTLRGIALGRREDRFKPVWWTKLFPLCSVEINKHTGQLDQVYRFRLRFMRCGIQYKTKGEAKCKGGWRGDYGFKFIFKGKVLVSKI
jgi:hypothetical protein